MKSTLRKGACAVVAVLALTTTIFIPQAHAAAHAEEAADSAEARYYDSVMALSAKSTTETVNYTRKEETYIETQNGVPLYYGRTDLANSCGPTGGSIVVGYYDKYYEELIPNYTGYYPASGKYKRMDTTYIPALIGDLYTLMRTNVDDVGVSESDCLNGLKSYVQSKGRSISYSSVKSGSSLNTTAYLNSLQNNKPVLLFCDQVGIVMFGGDSTSDVIYEDTIANKHIMVGFGYYQIKYYNGNTNFRTDTYLRAACGLFSYSDGFVKLSSSSWLDSGYAVSIS